MLPAAGLPLLCHLGNRLPVHAFLCCDQGEVVAGLNQPCAPATFFCRSHEWAGETHLWW